MWKHVARFSSLWRLNKCHCMHSSYPFIGQWTLGMLLPLGCCKECSCEHGCTNTSSRCYVKASVMVYIYNPSTQKVEAGRSWVWGQPGIHNELQANLGYGTLSKKQANEQTNKKPSQLPPIILAAWEAEIQRTTFWGQPRQIVRLHLNQGGT
jgi:hypothetical protein